MKALIQIGWLYLRAFTLALLETYILKK